MSILGGLQILGQALYPPRCLSCGDLVNSDFGLCGACWRDTVFLGESVCDACGTPVLDTPTDQRHRNLCDQCLTNPPPWVQGRSAVAYAKTGRKLVLAFKHGDRLEIARPAALWMAHAVRTLVTPDTLILPVPLHWRRMIRRRYNQSALLAKALGRHMDLHVGLDGLQRVQPTPSLDGMNRQQRAQTVADAIRVHPRWAQKLAGHPVLIVDDVMTTGATLRACTLACHAAGTADVRVVTLARADRMALV